MKKVNVAEKARVTNARQLVILLARVCDACNENPAGANMFSGSLIF